MRIAVVGGGISGLATAHLLSDDHEVTVFEANDRLGGHTHTVDVDADGEKHAVDTGFIVFNDRTYPNFMKLLDRIGVAWQPSDMSFSVRCETSGLEYNGTSLNSLFAQRRNLVRPSFLGMIRDILRFNREATAFVEDGDDETTLGQFLERNGYRDAFIRQYIVPMGAAIWSSGEQGMRDFPFRCFARFFHNHGMLSVNERPQWRVITGGSRNYLEPLVRPFRDRVRLKSPVTGIKRLEDGVRVKASGEPEESFDHVVIGAHGDQALAMLEDPSGLEREVLSAFAFQPNQTLLHTDAGALPRRSLARAAWNYHLPAEDRSTVGVTYWMNKLQSLASKTDFCVTLNRDDLVDEDRVLGRFLYDHPIFDRRAVSMQGRRDELNGQRNTWFCGAYWGFGFHEDGVNSALEVCRGFGKEL